MTGIQLNNEESNQYSTPIESRSFLVRLVLATRITSTEQQAQYVLVGIAALCIIGAFAIPFLFGPPNGQPEKPGDPSWPGQTSQ